MGRVRRGESGCAEGEGREGEGLAGPGRARARVRRHTQQGENFK